MKNAQLWELIDATYITKDYRLVATVERDENAITGSYVSETYDLGQNAAGEFMLFRRCTDPWMLNSHHKGERLSPQDFIGFGLGQKGYTIDEVCRAEEQGEFSSLCKSNLILT